MSLDAHLTHEEYERLWTAALGVKLKEGKRIPDQPVRHGTRSERNRRLTGLAILFAGEGGMRIGEIWSLRWPELIVNGEVVCRLVLRRETTKTKKSRVVPISRLLAWAIGECSRYAVSERVFDCHRETLGKQISAFARSVVGRRCTPHAFRHYAAKEMLGASDVPTVSAFLGHTRLQTTQFYLGVSAEQLELAYERRDQLRDERKRVRESVTLRGLFLHTRRALQALRGVLPKRRTPAGHARFGENMTGDSENGGAYPEFLPGTASGGNGRRPGADGNGNGRGSRRGL